jgi:putative tricarboxylic transport membrane protein
MTMVDHFLAGLGMVFTFKNLLAITFGVALGMPLGAIPGLAGVMAISLLLPLTFYMNPITAIAMLMAISKASIYGGSISAVLLNMPGIPASAATCLDGYELTKQGKSGKGLKMALYASVIGDISSDFVLLLVAAPIAMLALKFAPADYTMVILFSLTIIGVVGSDSPIKGMIAAGIGVLFATVGQDHIHSSRRFGFGLVDLDPGIRLMPMLVGLLVVSEVFSQLGERLRFPQKNGSVKLSSPDDTRVTWAEMRSCMKTIFRGTAIGTIFGSLPGIGATVAAYTSYAEAKRSSKHPEEFGKGSLEGVAAAESANNATCGANLIPLVTLGIPGNATAAVILGAFMLHGLTPGPFLMKDNAPMLYALFVALIVSNVFVFAIAHVFLKIAPRVHRVSPPILYPTILIFCAVGSYIFHSSIFDIKIMFIFGILGWILKKYGISNAVLLIAFILGKMFEYKLRLALIMSGGSLSVFVTRPISLIFLCLSILFVVTLVFFRQRVKYTE